MWTVIAGSLALVGVVSTVLVAGSVSRTDARASRSSLRLAASEVAASVKLEIQREDDLLISAGTFVAENPNATNADFRRWAAIGRVFLRYPEVLGIAKDVIVPAGRLGSFTARELADPVQPTAHPVFRLIPPGKRPYYCLSTIGQNRSAQSAPPAGVDFCVLDPGILSSRDTGQGQAYAVAANHIVVLGDEEPLYAGGLVPATVAGRRAASTGFIAMGIAPVTLLSRALQNHPNTALLLRRSSGANARSLSYGAGHAPAGARRLTIDLHDGSTVQILARVTGAGLFANGNAVEVLIAGTVLSVFLGLLVFLLGTGRARALRLVLEKTEQLSFQALHDGLTGLPNRALVIDRAELMMARARRQPTPIAAMFIDVDGFKHVNDTFGHAAGDQFLQIIAGRLSSVVRETDTVGRLGGDEFVVLLEGETLSAGPELVAERLLTALRQPFELDGSLGRSQTCSVSIGIAVGQRATADELLRDADLALYQAKQAGKDRYMVFDESMQIASADRLALEIDLRCALAKEQLYLLYQPTFDLQTQAVTGVEALIRWAHPERGVVGPDLFIPLAEENAMIIPIGRWVLQKACQQAALWHATSHAIGMSVNVSARQLERDEFVGEVEKALSDSGLAPEALTLEITETVLMRDAPAAAARLRALKALGVRIAIDDFGAGHSSLAYLRQFPVDALKIDRSFITGIASNREASALMHALIQLGKALGLETLGEGIEEHAELEQLKDEACDSGQGFLFARPLDAETVTRFLDRDQVPV